MSSAGHQTQKSWGNNRDYMGTQMTVRERSPLHNGHQINSAATKRQSEMRRDPHVQKLTNDTAEFSIRQLAVSRMKFATGEDSKIIRK